ncbi:unnamed protein product [Closterium sp. Naga37s-1]|nr:unnamed protein product [Closterium sp. Naga37s-1]
MLSRAAIRRTPLISARLRCMSLICARLVPPTPTRILRVSPARTGRRVETAAETRVWTGTPNAPSPPAALLLSLSCCCSLSLPLLLLLSCCLACAIYPPLLAYPFTYTLHFFPATRLHIFCLLTANASTGSGSESGSESGNESERESGHEGRMAGRTHTVVDSSDGSDGSDGSASSDGNVGSASASTGGGDAMSRQSSMSEAHSGLLAPLSPSTPTTPSPSPSPSSVFWGSSRARARGVTGEGKGSGAVVQGREGPEARGADVPMAAPSLAHAAGAVAAGRADGDGSGARGGGKEIFVVSDGTAWAADRAVGAAVGLLDCGVGDGRCSVHTRLYSQVTDTASLLAIIHMASSSGALLVHSLAGPALRHTATHTAAALHVAAVDLLGPLLTAVGEHMGVDAGGAGQGAGGKRVGELGEEYFRRIEAVEFTIRQDDGALPRNLGQADIILVGVSRTGKTPLSMHLAHMGYKVANVPLVPGVAPPAELLQANHVDQRRVFALTIAAPTLAAIRRARYQRLGLLPQQPHRGAGRERSAWGRGERGAAYGEGMGGGGRYCSAEHVRGELEAADDLFSLHPLWPLIDVTGRPIEETAALILRIYHERMNLHAVPFVTRCY